MIVYKYALYQNDPEAKKIYVQQEPRIGLAKSRRTGDGTSPEEELGVRARGAGCGRAREEEEEEEEAAPRADLTASRSEARRGAPPGGSACWLPAGGGRALATGAGEDWATRAAGERGQRAGVEERTRSRRADEKTTARWGAAGSREEIRLAGLFFFLLHIYDQPTIAYFLPVRSAQMVY
ncbi:hypothetical protein BS78_K157100 [Paspalum vaginatum]|uniref:Uncharacterized protein n=1 Tax=Paspalum vaginatum TaxID=158149 RepID=A0A9W8CCS3_9POAL|nr:hypothetical protein BS78_K157100 [Paspalum vaginatum]